MPKLRRFAMHEFSPEFDGDRGGWISASEDTPADSITRFQHDDIAACDTEITRGSQTSGARADNQDIRTFVFKIGKARGCHYIFDLLATPDRAVESYAGDGRPRKVSRARRARSRRRPPP